MSRIFLSHSSHDWREAMALKRWLGEHWAAQLVTSNTRCGYLICLVSKKWADSRECQVEYRTAEGFGKRILVARLEDAGDKDITRHCERCDLFADGDKTEIAISGGPPVPFNSAALDKIKKDVESTRVGPEGFAWPPKVDPRRAPYRGWEPFEDMDAGVFFGRDAAIARGLDALRTLRARAPTGRPIGEPVTGQTGPVRGVAFSPDGQRMGTGSADYTVRLWPGGTYPEALCAKLTSNMSRRQWREWVSPEIDYIPACPDLPIPPDDDLAELVVPEVNSPELEEQA